MDLHVYRNRNDGEVLFYDHALQPGDRRYLDPEIWEHLGYTSMYMVRPG